MRLHQVKMTVISALTLLIVSQMVAATLVLQTLAVAAEKKKLLPEGIIGEDDRVIMDSWEPPWNAVGRIFIQGFSRVRQCSGTLVDKRVVATAAHCLYDFISMKPVPAASVHFLAGWRREKYIGHATAACLKINPGFVFEREPNVERISNDYAFIVLKEAIDVTPIAIHKAKFITMDDFLVHAGYNVDRPYILSVHEGCRSEYEDANAYFTDCDTTNGASGGPLFVKENGKYSIAAVGSASYGFEVGGGFVPVSGFASILNMGHRLDEIRDCDE